MHILTLDDLKHLRLVTKEHLQHKRRELVAHAGVGYSPATAATRKNIIAEIQAIERNLKAINEELAERRQKEGTQTV